LNFPLYIAKRYLVSKKSHNIINIISAVSVAGVTVGTMALIIVLSVFNGFQDLVISLFSSFNPDIQVTAIAGKTFQTDTAAERKIRDLSGVAGLVEVIEENVLMKYKDKQYIVTLKGVGPDYVRFSRLDTMIQEGRFVLQEDGKEFAVLGYGVAYYLDAHLNDYLNPIEVYVPSRTGTPNAGLDQAFREESIFPSGFFSIQQDYDVKYGLVPIDFMKRLLDYKDELTSLEIHLRPGADMEQVKAGVQQILGDKFTVKDRYQQQALLYKIMKSEKWAIFLILSFILLIATFNVIGSLSILILDKRKDIAILKSMGAHTRTIHRIFLTEGLMISFIGAVAGMVLGAVICFIQQRFGLIRLGDADSTFVVNAYPVSMQAGDFFLIFMTVMAIGFLAAWYPVYNIRKMDTSLSRMD
jgi:lipoprotein-releasing system permease protein